MKFLYSIIVSLALPLALLRLLWKSRRYPAYRKRLGERLTLRWAHQRLPERTIWIHAVSVGEFLAVCPLVSKLLAQHASILITTTTPTASKMLRSKFGDRVFHQYLPLDVPMLAHRFLHRVRPSVAVFVETEIWPNYLHQLKKDRVPTLLINARLSEKSFQGYQKFGNFTRNAIATFTEVGCQDSDTQKRFAQLGANAHVVGNVKFDLCAPDNLAASQKVIEYCINNRNFIIAASTHPNEEALIVDAYQNSDEKRLLIIAPRHPERCDAVVGMIEKRGMPVERYSTCTVIKDNCQVLVIDTLGLLLPFYSLADYAIIGGSFVPHGGHNPLEAALFKTPCVIGKHYTNFAFLVEQMRDKKAITILRQQELFNVAPPPVCGKNALRFLQKNCGASDYYLDIILDFTRHPR